MRLFVRFTFWIILTGVLLSLDGFLYAKTPNDVVLITLCFIAIADVLVALTFGRHSSVNVNPSNLGRTRIPLEEN